MYDCYEKCNILDSCVKSLRDGRRRSLKRERIRYIGIILDFNEFVIMSFFAKKTQGTRKNNVFGERVILKIKKIQCGYNNNSNIC